MIQGSREWHSWRVGKIGASQIGPIIGADSFGKTPYSTWLEIMGRSQFEGNVFTEHGKKMEPRARSKYEHLTGESMGPACATHSYYPMCISSLDGFCATIRKLLEIKCPMGQSVLNSVMLGRVPSYYVPQVYYQLAVTGADSLAFFVYHHRRGISRIVEVKPNFEYQQRLILAAVNFWNAYVRTDTPPPLLSHDVKLVSEPLVTELCLEIEAGHKTIPKHKIDFLKERVVRMAGHHNVRCGNVEISTVIRRGQFSFHKLVVNPREAA